jgi:hypothetical protein
MSLKIFLSRRLIAKSKICEKNIFGRPCTNIAALLSSNALYPALLGILAAAVTSHLGGMAIAEDILRGDPCNFYFQNQRGLPTSSP